LLVGIVGGEQLSHGARRRRTEGFVGMDCLRQLNLCSRHPISESFKSSLDFWGDRTVVAERVGRTMQQNLAHRRSVIAEQLDHKAAASLLIYRFIDVAIRSDPIFCHDTSFFFWFCTATESDCRARPKSRTPSRATSSSRCFA